MIEEKMETTILSEKVLAKDWNTKEEDEAWKELQLVQIQHLFFTSS